MHFYIGCPIEDARKMAVLILTIVNELDRKQLNCGTGSWMVVVWPFEHNIENLHGYRQFMLFWCSHLESYNVFEVYIIDSFF